MFNPDYIPSGPANARNEYEMKVNHTKIARVDSNRSEYFGSRGGVPGFDFTTGLLWFYDPSDLSTMFQDAAFSTPVTASGQQVNSMLDKSSFGRHVAARTVTGNITYQTDGTLHWLEGNGNQDGLFGTNPGLGTDDFFISAAVRMLEAGNSTLPTVVSSGPPGAGNWLLRKHRDTRVAQFNGDNGGIFSDMQGSDPAVDEVLSVYRTAEGVRLVQNVDTLGPLDTIGVGADLTSATNFGLMTVDDGSLREWNGRVYATAGYTGTVDLERRNTIDNFMMARAGLISSGDPEYDNLITYGGSPLTYMWEPLTYGD